MSRERTRATLLWLRRLLSGRPAVMQTDEKGAYSLLLRQLFGSQIRHERTPGRLVRTVFNPLFPINHMHATMRERNARLRIRSWLVSKRGRQLEQQLVLERCWRNFCWRRFNRDGFERTPAVEIGLLPRRLATAEVVRWRQDWGARSIHPLSADGGKHS